MRDCSIPLSFNWTASKHIEKEDAQRPEGYDDHAYLENPFVSFLNSNSEEETRNAQFDEHYIENVKYGRKCFILAATSACRSSKEFNTYLSGLRSSVV
jgi:hypothetical protein